MENWRKLSFNYYQIPTLSVYLKKILPENSVKDNIPQGEYCFLQQNTISNTVKELFYYIVIFFLVHFYYKILNETILNINQVVNKK